MEKDPNSAKHDRESLWLLQINTLSQNNLFVVFSTGETDRPLLENGNIIFYSKDQLLENFFERSEVESEGFCLKDHLDFIYDINKLFNLIESLSVKDSGYILDCLNLLFDAVAPLNIVIPRKNENLLKKFADHLTFNREMSGYLKKKKISVDDIFSSLYLYHGILLVNSRQQGLQM